jgi:hypothetical protein
MNFKNLQYFLGIETIKNDLKPPHSVGPKSARSYNAQPGSPPLAVARSPAAQ